jgi:predicted transposase/invertase (TIGR01784 family)
MGTGIDPKVDYVFKRLFGAEENALLLVDLLNAVLGFPPGRLVRGVTLLNPFVTKDYIESKVPILDVRARDDPGRQFLLEMQLFGHTGFAKRLLYYWAGGHAEQLQRGERYEMLHPTYCICCLNETLLADDVFHHPFQVYDAEHGVLLCKDLEIHLLELSKFNLQVEMVQSPLERWCYFLKHGASLDPASLPATLDVPVIRKAMEVLMKISQDELERHRAAERKRAQQFQASLEADHRVAHEGLQAAREELQAAREELQAAREELQAEQEQARAAQAAARTAQEAAARTAQEAAARTAQEAARAAQEAARAAQEAGLEKGKRIGRIQLLQQLLQQPETSSEQLNQRTEEDLAQLEQSLQHQLAARRQANGPPPTDKK